MYRLEGAPGTSKDQAMLATVGFGDQSQRIEVWHARLGHFPETKINELGKCGSGLKLAQSSGLDNTNEDVCSGCAKGRLTVKPSLKMIVKGPNTNEVLQLVHSDVMGPMTPSSSGGSKYVVTSLDDYSRCMNVYSLKPKLEAVDYFV